MAVTIKDVAREAGMAEIATGVLHNVGNVLNSVNVSTNLLTERAQSSRIETMMIYRVGTSVSTLAVKNCSTAT